MSSLAGWQLVRGVHERCSVRVGVAVKGDFVVVLLASYKSTVKRLNCVVGE